VLDDSDDFPLHVRITRVLHLYDSTATSHHLEQEKKTHTPAQDTHMRLHSEPRCECYGELSESAERV
jgi:hypothetical protein